MKELPTLRLGSDCVTNARFLTSNPMYHAVTTIVMYKNIKQSSSRFHSLFDCSDTLWHDDS